MSLHRQRCFRHQTREAAARCPSCSRSYCRECVVEHDGRLLCVDCLAAAGSKQRPARSFTGVKWALLSAAGFCFSWMVFYYAGAWLARMPADFHVKADK